MNTHCSRGWSALGPLYFVRHTTLKAHVISRHCGFAHTIPDDIFAQFHVVCSLIVAEYCTVKAAWRFVSYRGQCPSGACAMTSVFWLLNWLFVLVPCTWHCTAHCQQPRRKPAWRITTLVSAARLGLEGKTEMISYLT